LKQKKSLSHKSLFAARGGFAKVSLCLILEIKQYFEKRKLAGGEEEGGEGRGEGEGRGKRGCS
jgi:hypothetical protein